MTTGDMARAPYDAQFWVEQIATLATALAAGAAAFYSIVPGSNRKLLWLPLIPFAIWLAALGQGCVRDWLRLGAHGVDLRVDWGCFPSMAAIGILPAIAMVVMLRRGAPLFPRVSVALGGLAVAAVANFGLRLYHVGDATIMVLVWHMGCVALLTVLAGVIGRQVLYWR